MSYTIYKADGTPVVVPDNVVDVAFYNPTGGSGGKGLGTQLAGRYIRNYGALTAQNFLQLTENFASDAVPADETSLQGQLWFNKISPSGGNLYIKTSTTSTGIGNWQLIGAGGTVTSVDAAGTQGVTIAGNPITTSGTISIGLGNITPTSVSTSGALTLSGSQQIFGAQWNATQSTSARLQNTTANTNTLVPLSPSGTATESGLVVYNTSTYTNASFGSLYCNATETGILSGKNGTGTAIPLIIYNQGLRGITVDTSANIIIGGVGQLATTATNRFLYITSMAGTPTGTPATPVGYTAKVPVTADTTNNKLYFNSNGSWRNTNTPDYEEVVATASQTVFNLSIRAVAKTGTKSFLQVFVNGVFKQEGASKDYQVTGPAQITFNAGVALSANVVIYGYA